MYRLLIVDDESIIANGLFEVFSSLKEPELDVYRAYSGKQAMLLLNKTRIDIVLTDINMPGMNGLQLLEQIHQRWPNCRVIFLTGHNEFDYVYTAIQYEGVSYLLKTEGYDKVIQAVGSAVSEIEKSFRQDALLQEAEKQLGTYRELLRRNFLNGIVKGRFFEKEISQQQLDELEIPLNAGQHVILLVGRVDNMPKGLPYSEKSRRLHSISIIAHQYFTGQLKYGYHADENYYLIWFIQPDTRMPDENGTPNCMVYLKGSAELIQNACVQSLNASVSFALDDSPSRWREIPDRFEALKMVLNYRIGQDSGMLLTERKVMEKDIRKTQGKENSKLSTIRLKFELLAETLEFGKKEDFISLFDGITEGLRGTQSMHNIDAVEQYASIALIFLSYVNRWNLLQKVAFKIGIHKLMHYDEHETWADAVDYLYQLASILFELQHQEQEKRAQDVIGLIQKHINDNLGIQEEVSLVRLADLVHFNPSYLSRLFKQMVGTNLSDYISDIRIKKAKQLLENKDMKINSVAEALGYGTAANFTRFFKKAVNMTPQEYRDFIA
jgi:two-component system response regulator YesN